MSPPNGKKCGGVGLVVRETKRFTVENANVEWQNVLSFHMLTGKDERWHVVGCYLPPSDKAGEARRTATGHGGARRRARGLQAPLDWRFQLQPGLPAGQTG